MPPNATGLKLDRHASDGLCNAMQRICTRIPRAWLPTYFGRGSVLKRPVRDGMGCDGPGRTGLTGQIGRSTGVQQHLLNVAFTATTTSSVDYPWGWPSVGYRRSCLLLPPWIVWYTQINPTKTLENKGETKTKQPPSPSPVTDH